jgi:hypothetical protein
MFLTWLTELALGSTNVFQFSTKGLPMNTHTQLLRRGIRTVGLVAASGAGLMASQSALAELSPALDRVSISVGVFQADPKLDASLITQYGNLQTGNVTLGKETLPRIKADLILFDSQGLSLDYYQYKHSYTGAVANNINVLGNGLITTGNANLDFKMDFAKLSYKWWLGSGDTVLGLGAGAAYYKIDMNANATAAINNTTASTSGAFVDDAVAPLLEIALRHSVNPELRLFAKGAGVKKTGGRMHGDIYNAAVGLEWFPMKNLGVVLDYSMSQIDITRDATYETNLKFKVQGPSTFVKLRF